MQNPIPGEAGEVAQWLAALVAMVEEGCLVPSFHTGSSVVYDSSSEHLTPSVLCGHLHSCVHSIHTHTYMHAHTQTHT